MLFNVAEGKPRSIIYIRRNYADVICLLLITVYSVLSPTFIPVSEIWSLLIRVNNTAGVMQEGDSFWDIHE